MHAASVCGPLCIVLHTIQYPQWESPYHQLKLSRSLSRHAALPLLFLSCSLSQEAIQCRLFREELRNQLLPGLRGLFHLLKVAFYSSNLKAINLSPCILLSAMKFTLQLSQVHLTPDKGQRRNQFHFHQFPICPLAARVFNYAVTKASSALATAAMMAGIVTCLIVATGRHTCN